MIIKSKTYLVSIDFQGTERWLVGDSFHRVGLPAIIYCWGTTHWWQDGEYIKTLYADEQ